MSIDLSQFHQVFYEESFEGLDIMESALMELDPNNIDDETINAIFRAAHSIKGGSATFGFTSISEFTHVLETLLDEVRAGKRGVSGDEINLFLRSVDCMREMLQLLQDGDSGHTEDSEVLKKRFSEILSGEASAVPSSVPKTDASDITDVSTSTVSWVIDFRPGVDILKTGNDPVRLIRELGELGEISTETFADTLPKIAEMDAEGCFLSWRITLAADVEKELIEEVFEWVADESEIIISREEVVAAESTPQSSADSSPAEHTWQITFKPNKEILQSGNDPSKIFAVLADLGEMDVVAHTSNLLPLSQLDSEHCYLYWDVFLKAGPESVEAIHEAFEWVADESDINIAPISNAGNVSKSEPVLVQSAPSDSRAAEHTEASEKQTGNESGAAKEQVVENSSANDIAATQAPDAKAAAPKAAPKVKKAASETSSIRVGIDKVDSLINMVGELVITQSMLGQLGTDFEVDRVPKLLEGLGQLEQNTRELQESVMRIRMLPISFAFSRFPRMVRDLSQSLNKSINLEMLGEQTELDKTVMEKIGDPLVHLVRNSIDHGIESPAERVESGKSEAGNITLNAFHQSGNVVIEVEDDGRGLDAEKLKAKAVKNGLISQLEADSISQEQAYDLIFQPGFSTAKAVTDVSGRGVGMDVVKKNIQALNGSVEISSALGVGTKITIRLPLTLAILDGQLVRVGENTYVFPLTAIVESLQCKSEFVSRMAGGYDVFRLRDDYVPIINLAEAFSIRADSKSLDQALMVVVESEGEKVGIIVDELLAQQQVVIKSLEQNYRRIAGISGATILGNGTVALIVDMPGVIRLAGHEYKSAQSKLNNALTASFIEQQRAV